MDTDINSSETALAPLPPPEALGVFREPDIVLEEARKAAIALMNVVQSKKRGVRINGETYLEYEDWQTLGRFYSMTPVVKATREVTYGEARGWEATAEVLLVPTNQVISSAEAMCLDDEARWSNKPSFQLRSMAQTRACAKALRNVLAWVVVLAGYRPTPAEEVGSAEKAEKPKPNLFADMKTMKQLQDQYWTRIKPLQDSGTQANNWNRALIDEIVKAKDQRKKELEAEDECPF